MQDTTSSTRQPAIPGDKQYQGSKGLRDVNKGRDRKGDSENKGESSDTKEQSQALPTSPKGRRQAVKCFHCAGLDHLSETLPIEWIKVRQQANTLMDKNLAWQ